jgi:hypothetical protein
MVELDGIGKKIFSMTMLSKPIRNIIGLVIEKL